MSYAATNAVVNSRYPRHLRARELAVLEVALPAIVALLAEALDGSRRRGNTTTPVAETCTMHRTNSVCTRGHTQIQSRTSAPYLRWTRQRCDAQGSAA